MQRWVYLFLFLLELVASNKQILSVTGDGSIELNIQELKTISDYNLNIKTFLINNGGYVSMKK